MDKRVIGLLSFLAPLALLPVEVVNAEVYVGASVNEIQLEANNMNQKAEHRPFIGLGQGVIGGPDESAAYKIIPFRLGLHREFDRPGALEKGAHLRQCFDVVVIHDGIHPSIMNRNQASSVSFRVRNTAPVQYHLVLDKAGTCFVAVLRVY